MFNLFNSEITTALDNLAHVNDLFETEKTVMNDVGNLPLNVYTTEDGTKYIELAIPGKTKENVKLSQDFKDGARVLSIAVESPELTDEEKKERKARQYVVQKIKGMNGAKFAISIPENYDLDSLKAKVENGLLTVTIKKVAAEQPRTFIVD